MTLRYSRVLYVDVEPYKTRDMHKVQHIKHANSNTCSHRRAAGLHLPCWS